MRVTKFVHSCLLVEQDGISVLIDPGEYSWPHINMDALPTLDALLFTHNHHDHYVPEATLQLRDRFPQLEVIANSQVAQTLADLGIKVAKKRPDWLEIGQAKHPVPPWAAGFALNTVFHIFGRLTHPGDSHTFSNTREILALPITAPWGSMMSALNYAIKLQPKVVLPIHDWHWSEAGRQDGYAKAARALSQHNIQFIPLETGISVEL